MGLQRAQGLQNIWSKGCGNAAMGYLMLRLSRCIVGRVARGHLSCETAEDNVKSGEGAEACRDVGGAKAVAMPSQK